MTDEQSDSRESQRDAKESTFLVTHADEASAVLKDVHDGQVHSLASNPGLDPDDVIEGSVALTPPLEVAWELVDVEDRRSIGIEESVEPPTQQEREIAGEQSVGELTTRERAGDGEIHVLTVPEDATDEAVADVVEDREGTLSRAARLGVNRIEVRSQPGVVSVRYMP